MITKTCDICHKDWEDDGYYSSVTITFDNPQKVSHCTVIKPILCPVCMSNMMVAINLVKDYPDFEERLWAFREYKPNDLKEIAEQ